MPVTKTITSTIKTACYHCGEDCDVDDIRLEEKSFCCEGCKMVFEILNENGLCQFYDIEDKAGISLKGKKMTQYAYLDDAVIIEQLIDYSDEKIIKATFYLPQIHCASCIWLLENLYKLNEGVLSSKVNFIKKELYISFSKSITSYRKMVELLASIGYAPAINLSDLDAPKKQVVDKQFYYQIGVAGFAFGNIMLMSLPEYFGLAEASFREIFGYLNVLLILPVVFFSGREYLQSAWQGLKQRHLNIDVPISLGILTLFIRSLFEIFTHTGAGYLDSLAGLVFFLLIGKWFQQMTYHQLSFERDYKSYFPIAAAVLKNGKETSVALSQLNIGDIILLRHGELIPADGILQEGKAFIDYSFVTGESEPVRKEVDEKLYAGGRQKGGSIQLVITKKVTQSYLTQLWNDDTFQRETSSSTSSELANRVSKYFTYTILTIAFGTLFFWLPKDMSLAINAFTAVLIIACPCAVALSIPFTFGNALRLMGRAGFYLKNTNVIEQLNELTTIVFDKTGTITKATESQLSYQGEALSEVEKRAIYSLAKQSSHPVSRKIAAFLETKLQADSSSSGILKITEVIDFEEIIGEGVKGFVNNFFLEIVKSSQKEDNSLTKGTAIKINQQIKGVFTIQNTYRNGFQQLLEQWKINYQLFLLSGDNDSERSFLEKFLPQKNIHFHQSPKDKLLFIKNRQETGEKILMLGDGLNDAGALQQANIGIVIAEDTNNFTPACDAILDARQFERLPDFLKFAQSSLKIVYASFIMAFIYNVVGLSFAVQGTLSPVIAAILMPLSSITIVVFGVGMTYFLRPRGE